MGTKRYRDYIEKVKELNVVLQQLNGYNHSYSVSDYMIDEMNNNVEFFNNIRKIIDYIKKDYSIRVNVNLDDIVLYHMKDYYLLYSKKNKDNVWCYDLEGNNIWKSNTNVKFIYENGEDFVIAIANESIDELESAGYIFRFMTYKDSKIKRVPDVTIEDVLEYKDLNDNLIEIKSGNGKVSVFDKKLGKIIIRDVGKIEKSDEIKGFFITKKLFDDKYIDVQFPIDTHGYIIGNLIDSECGIHHISKMDRCNKTMHIEMLEKKFEEIRVAYQEKGKQLVRK